MSQSIKILSFIFMIQITILVLFKREDSSSKVFKANKNLINIDISKIEKIIIQNREKNSVVLNKSSSGWHVSNLFDFPADQGKAEQLLNQVQSFKRPWPTGKSPSAAKQLATSEQNYEKKIFLQRYSINELYLHWQFT